MSDRIEDVTVEPAEMTPATTDAEHVAATETKEDRNFVAKVCAWTAFLLVISMFVFLVAAGRNFPLGWYLDFAACLVCVIGLLLGGIRLWHRNKGGSFLTSLIFLLAVIAMAAVGVLPIYFFPCVDSDPVYSYYDDAIKNGFELVTETENLPSEVQTWWENDVLMSGRWRDRYSNYSRSNGNNVLYLNSIGISLFTDTDGQGGDEEYLYRMENGQDPELFKEIVWPRDFVLIDDGALACFIFETTESRYVRKVACTDGVSMNQTEETFSSASHLFYSNELIWFRCTIHSEEIGYGDDVLYSMDPFSPEETLTLHSSLDESFDLFATRECSNAFTLQSISWFFLSAIPALLIAIALDVAYNVPSMPIGEYGSTTWLAVYGFAWMFSGLDTFDLGEFVYAAFQWWSVFTAGPWLVLLTFMDLTNRITKRRLVWSINFAALVYTVGVFCLFDVFRWGDWAWDWVWLTVAVVPGLVFISMVTGQMFLMILAAVVILIDVWRLVDYIVYDVGNWQTSLPAQVVVLVLAALLLGFLIWLVWKRQSLTQTVVSKWAKSKLSCCWRPPSVPVGENNECPTHAATNSTSSIP